MMGQSSTIAPHGSAHYLNRELSWVALYRRLLYEAADDRWPLFNAADAVSPGQQLSG
jgi:polyphosphate kinase